MNDIISLLPASLSATRVAGKGFPTPRRTKYRTGLEIPLKFMTELARSPRLHEFDRQSSPMGISHLLIHSGPLETSFPGTWLNPRAS